MLSQYPPYPAHKLNIHLLDPIQILLVDNCKSICKTVLCFLFYFVQGIQGNLFLRSSLQSLRGSYKVLKTPIDLLENRLLYEINLQSKSGILCRSPSLVTCLFLKVAQVTLFVNV